MIVEDASVDPRFRENELVSRAPFVRFYAGAPLLNPQGLALGTVCVMAREPRQLAQCQIEALKAIARQVINQLELRRLILTLESRHDMLQQSTGVLESHHRSLSRANARLQRQSSTDSLTGLRNRRAFAHDLMKAVADSQARNDSLALIMLDVDHFKTFNDDWGHPEGDAILKRVASLLQLSARNNDAVSRYGGEEFAIICPSTTEEQAMRLAGRVCDAISKEPWRARRITMSAGVAAQQAGLRNEETLIAAADQALYQAKRGGRNMVVPFSRLIGKVQRNSRARKL